MIDKIIYQQTYKKPYPKWNDPSKIKTDSICKDVIVKSVGIIEIKNQKYEFQDLRVLFEYLEE